jgi:cobalt/nickel transport system permease protein
MEDKNYKLVIKLFENTLDGYAHSNGLRNANTYFKVLFAIVTMIVNLVSTSPVVPITIFLIMTFLILFKANIPSKFYLKFITIPFTFAFITFVFMAIFFGVGTPILNFGIFHLAVTVDGFNLGLLVLARIMGGFSCLAFLALTTPITELFSVLENIKIPKILLEIAMLMYRYIFVFLDEAINMYHSQETRLGYSSLKKTYKSMGMLASNLFIRTWMKGEQIYITMESRCYDGTLKTFKTHENISIKNLLILILFESSLLLGTYLTWGLKII